MDAFYASVEQRDNPELRGKPIAIGHAERRGVVATASYEARRFGIRSAMPSVTARRMCPDLIFVPGDFKKYKAVSAQMHEIFHEYTDQVEPISLDEAFLDVTINKPGIEFAVDIAKEIKAKIRQRLNLVASAGVSYNKFLAKVASDYRKPDGLCTIHPSRAQSFIDALDIEAFWGVGPVTAEKMHRLGIHKGIDLRNAGESFLRHEFGKAGAFYFQFANGIDNRPVCAERTRKSVGCEVTLASDVAHVDDALPVFEQLADDLLLRLQKSGFKGHTFTLKIKHSNFQQKTRSVTEESTDWTRERILSAALGLLSQIDMLNNPVRLFGFTISGIDEDKEPVVESEIYARNDMGLWRQLRIPFDDQVPY